MFTHFTFSDQPRTFHSLTLVTHPCIFQIVTRPTLVISPFYSANDTVVCSEHSVDKSNLLCIKIVSVEWNLTVSRLQRRASLPTVDASSVISRIRRRYRLRDGKTFHALPRNASYTSGMQHGQQQHGRSSLQHAAAAAAAAAAAGQQQQQQQGQQQHAAAIVIASATWDTENSVVVLHLSFRLTETYNLLFRLWKNRNLRRSCR